MEKEQYRKVLYLGFKNDNPETIGETDKDFDRTNYIKWLENKLFSLTESATKEECERCPNCSIRLFDHEIETGKCDCCGDDITMYSVTHPKTN